jgi:hypothetical protein
MRRSLAIVVALAALIVGCDTTKVQPLYPGAYFPLARGPN